MEEVEFLMDETDSLKELPGEKEMVEAGEEACREEGGFEAAKGVEGGVEKEGGWPFLGVSFGFNFLVWG